MIRNFTLLCFHLFFIATAYAYKPLLHVDNFDRQVYAAGRQNWSVDVDDHGVVYFANNNGLLTNTFGRWDLYPSVENETLKSIAVSSDTVWAGGNKTVGYFTRDTYGAFQYHVLKELEMYQVWNVVKFNHLIYYQTDRSIICYDTHSQGIKVEYIDDGLWDLVVWEDQLWAISRGGWLGTIQGLDFQPLHTNHCLMEEVRSMVVHNDQLFIQNITGGVSSFKSGVFQSFPMSKALAEKAKFSMLSYGKDELCFGTISNGLIRVNNDGNVTASIDNKGGLIDNTVLAMASDGAGNIWLGLDYGIAKVELHQPLQTIFNSGATYDIEISDDGTIYLATNKGVYYADSLGDFQMIEGSGGQTWALVEIESVVYACHNNGLYRIRDAQMELLYDKTGVMGFEKLPGENAYIVSSYTGAFVVYIIDDNLQFGAQINYWEHPHFIYDQQANRLWGDTEDGLIVEFTMNTDRQVSIETPTEMKSCFETDYGVVYTDDKHLYTLKNQQFVQLDLPVIQLNDGKIQSLQLSANGQMLNYVQAGTIHHKMCLPDGNVYAFDQIMSPLNDKLVTGFECIVFHNQVLYIANERGVEVFDMAAGHIPQPQSPNIISIQSDEGDHRTDLYLYPMIEQAVRFDSNTQKIMIEYGAQQSSKEKVEYRYKLFPADLNWSEWSKSTEPQSYHQLKGGAHTFQLQKRLNGKEILQCEIHFEIEKKWFQTWLLALPIFFLIVCIVLLTIYVMHIMHAKRTKDEEEQSAINLHKQNVAMKNEQLLQYVEVITHKNEFLFDMRGRLEQMRNVEAKNLVNLISDELNHEKKEFIFHKLFSEVHQDFVHRLTESYPKLTQHDVRILTFIRVNLSSKEIAHLMNISIKSVDINRYRIKKKMVLGKEIDLNVFVREF